MRTLSTFAHSSLALIGLACLSSSSVAQEPAAPKVAVEAEAAAASETPAKETKEAEAPATEEPADKPAEAEAAAPAEATAATAAAGGEAAAAPAESSPDFGPQDAQEAAAGEEGAAAAEEGATATEAAEAEPKKEAKIVANDVVPPPPKPDPNTLPFTYHMKGFELAMAMRVQSWQGDSIERWVYSRKRGIPEFRIGASYDMGQRFAFGWDLAWNMTAAEEHHSGYSSLLSTHSLGMGLKGQYFFNHRFSLYGRVAPGVRATTLSLDPDEPTEQKGTGWGFNIDGGLGVAVRVAGHNDGSQRGARLSFFGEFDYGWGTAPAVEVEHEEPPTGAEPLTLAPVRITGPSGVAGILLKF